MAELPEETRALIDSVLGASWTAQPLRGDASTRLYWRITSGDRTVIASFYPEQIREGLSRALRAWESLSPCVPLPSLLGSDECGIVQEDIGDETLLSVLLRDRERGLELYAVAVDLLESLQSADTRGREINPPFTSERFMTELDMTGEWYVERLAGGTYGPELRDAFRRLCDRLEQHPRLLCHRDYHGENLHVIGERLVMIDFQDLRLGPDTYDLASLLRDRGVARVLGRDEEEKLIERWVRIRGDDEIRNRYGETLLQRTIKILGTFARQSLERGRAHYLDHIDPALETIVETSRWAPEWEHLARAIPFDWRR